MIILDTNVVSELMKAAPDRAVLRWLNRLSVAVLHTTSVTEAEITHGVLLLPKGKRRDAVAVAAATMFETEFEDRILSFDSAAARAYAAIMVQRRSAGRPMAAFDAQIAAIATVHRAQLATRNVDDFSDCGLDLVDPWLA